MARRKRLEAWGVKDSLGFLYNQETRPTIEGLLGPTQVLAAGASFVHLVECGPDETVVPRSAAAVVRAAVKWARAGDVCPDECRALVEAAERMQKGRRR